jgi:uncharacterized protein YbaR (Trm112 family)
MDNKLLKSTNYSEFLRKNTTLSQTKIIQISYDLQTGSYEEAYDSEMKYTSKESAESYHKKAVILKNKVLEIINNRKTCKILECGMGEGNMIRHLYDILDDDAKDRLVIYGFDISFSRIKIVRKYIPNSNLFVGDLNNIPLSDNSFDIVFTHSAIEPNKDKETQILKELYKKTSNYLILFEPTYEEASDEVKKRFLKHNYVMGLKKKIEDSFNLVDYGKIYSDNTYCQYKYIIKKDETINNIPSYICPLFGSKLSPETYSNMPFMKSKLVNLYYPVVDNIPILLGENSIPINN